MELMLGGSLIVLIIIIIIFLGHLFETGGDDVLSVIMNDYGKPTHAQHIYLPYYQGRNVLRKLQLKKKEPK
jgi:hypothetical protein